MSDSTLHYQHGDIEDLLEPGRCTVRRCREGTAFYWRLWFVVRDEVGVDAGHIALLTVRLNIGGPPVDGAPGARSWGFARIGDGMWAVAPSINVADVWHHTPVVVDAPEPAPWAP